MTQHDPQNDPQHGDPKLTAFALNELTPSEREAYEAELDEAARAEIAEIEQLSQLLETEFQQEPMPSLGPAQRERIEAAARGETQMTEPRTQQKEGRVIKLWWRGPAVAAAGLMLAGGLSLTFMSSSRQAMHAEVADGTGPAAATAEVSGQMDREEQLAQFATLEMERDQRKMHRTPQLAPQAQNAGEGLVSPGDVSDAAVAGRPMPAPEPPAPRQPGTSSPPPPMAPQVGRVKIDSVEPEPTVRPDTHTPPSENDFVQIDLKNDPESALSTFSIDVDTASYANVRQTLLRGGLPSPSMVRIEELINYFDYDYALPTGDEPFACHVEVAACPWNEGNRLVRVGLQGQVIERAQRPASNLVFLLDVSGSMSAANKLPLLKQAFELLIAQLDERDKVSIVVYAGASGVALPPTSGEDRNRILETFSRLRSGGSTNGGAGIQLAYKLARDNFVEGGVNRVILATDGDFNVGATSRSALTTLVENQAKSGVFLSVLGFGMSGRGDGTMETLADKGNGNYGYVDTLREAQKILVTDMTGTLITIAKDVKIQLDFNHHKVKAYRLIGYENRMLAAQDFLDDTKDAGEIGAGHNVTALYEVVLTGSDVIPSRYGDTPTEPTQPLSDAAQNELMTVRLNYKLPDSDTGQGAAGITQIPVRDVDQGFGSASVDFRFAASVAAFGQILRDSKHKGSLKLADVFALASESTGHDELGYRGEFLELIQRARQLTGDRR